MQTMIKNCAQAGIPSIKYNMSILGVVRSSGRTPGRGDAMYSTWKLSEAHPATPLTKAGVVESEIVWERITYFLDRVIPVANEYKIRMACHPHDPGMPPEGYQGVNRVLGTVDGLKKFITIQESPYHGLNFCRDRFLKCWRIRARKSTTSSATSGPVTRFSMCTSVIFAAIATIFWRFIPMRGMLTS